MPTKFKFNKNFQLNNNAQQNKESRGSTLKIIIKDDR